MPLKRKMLEGMSLTPEQTDAIMEAHYAEVSDLKDEIDKAKESAKTAVELQTQLDAANKQIESLSKDEYKDKYDSLKTEYDQYKTGIEADKEHAKKETAYKQLLTDAGVSDKRINSVLKISASAIDGLELDKEGKVKNSDKLSETVKTDWADFIETTTPAGASVANPPKQPNGSETDEDRMKRLGNLSMADYIAEMAKKG